MPRRAYLMRFSLRALLLLTTGVCICLSIWAYRANTQHRAVTAIRAVGARVDYSPTTLFSWTPPSWLVDATGPDFFFGVKLVILYPEASESTDEQIKLLGGLYSLKRLAIYPGCKGRTGTLLTDQPGGLTDEGAEYLLKYRRSLRHLALLSARLSDEECLKLKKAIPSCQIERHSEFGLDDDLPPPEQNVSSPP
jgi:hypothetical protein